MATVNQRNNGFDALKAYMTKSINDAAGMWSGVIMAHLTDAVILGASDSVIEAVEKTKD